MGEIDTWSYNSDGDFTHTPPQWIHKAWLRPSTKADSLRLTIVSPRSKNISREVYAVYHGRFIEMLLALFDQLFAEAVASALPEQGDIVSSS